MSLWVKLYSNFYSHRKTSKLRAELGDDAFWIPPRIWAYAVENQPDGNFLDYSAQEIANLIGYNKDADKMLHALLHARFMDSEPLRIHDWHEHGAIHVAYSEKCKKAANARWERARELKESNQRKETETETEREKSDAFASAIAAAFAPVAPAAGVRQQLVAYEMATDLGTGISLNYRHWGVAQQDRDYEVIESAYGYSDVIAAALKRLTKPA